MTVVEFESCLSPRVHVLGEAESPVMVESSKDVVIGKEVRQ